MKPEDAAKKLSFHLMQCGMMMPIKWIIENGEGSELQQAFRIALDALDAIEYREYSCPDCGHTWLEDRDASDYPEYCPGCGAALRDGSTSPNEPLTMEDGKKERYIWFTPLNDWAKVTPFGVLFFGSEELMTWETLCEEWWYRFKAYRRPPEGEEERHGD